ncbi:MAG: hypothetical protein Kow0069_27810 [Promethearchaeota archaeon]
MAIIIKGGNADTNAAVAGNLLGAKFGAGGIPSRWRRGLAGADVVVRVAADLFALQDRGFGVSPALDV